MYSKMCVFFHKVCVSSGYDVESLQSSGELRLHGLLALMGLKDQ